MSALSFIKHPYTAAMQAEVAPHLPAIATFRSLIAPLIPQYPESFPLSQCIHDDRACYRWLKARHFNPVQATAMMTSALQYRAQHQLDTILSRPFPKAEQIRLGSRDSWHGHDKEGRPILISRFGSVDAAALHLMATDEERVTYHHYVSEFMHRIVLPQASARCGHLVDSFSCLFDMQGFSTALITKHSYNFVSATIRINSLLYPEAMGQCLIVNCPFVFAMGWNMVKAAIDDVTRSKIVIVRGLGQERISALIDAQELPEFLGGKCRCQGEGGCMVSSEMDVRFGSWLRQHDDCGRGCEETVVGRKGSNGSDGGETEAEYSSGSESEQLCADDSQQMIQSSA